MPGSTPIRLPMNTPKAAHIRLSSAKAMENPCIRLLKISMADQPQTAGTATAAPGEHGQAQQRHAHGQQRRALDRVLAVAHRRDEHQRQRGRHQAAELAQRDEGQQSADDAAPAAPVRRRVDLGLFVCRLRRVAGPHDGRAQQRQQHAQDHREHARAHAGQRADVVAGRVDGGAQPQRDHRASGSPFARTARDCCCMVRSSLLRHAGAGRTPC